MFMEIEWRAILYFFFVCALHKNRETDKSDNPVLLNMNTLVCKFADSLHFCRQSSGPWTEATDIIVDKHLSLMWGNGGGEGGKRMASTPKNSRKST